MDGKKTETQRKIEEYLEKADTLPKTFEKGDIVKGKVVRVQEGEVMVNVGGRAEGVISGRELSLNGKREKLSEGEEVLVYVTSPANEDGWMELSIRKTGEARRWRMLDKVQEEGEVIEVEVMEANNGGVIVNIEDDFRGFIPTSQLENERIYPLGSFGDKAKAARELQKKLAGLINEKIKAKIIEIDRNKNRVILSEKLVNAEADMEEREETLKQAKEGDVLEGEVTGIAPFGLFVNASGLEGLVHLSEISWDKVEDPSDFYKVGDEVKVEIIGIEDDGRRIAFSIKRLKKDPWDEMIKKYKVGQIVSGEVTKVVEYGAFVRIDGKVNGLVHISELSDGLVKDPGKFVKEGETYDLAIISISKSERHLGLSLKQAKKGSEKKTEKKKDLRQTQDKEGEFEEESAEELRSLEEAG